MRDDHTPQTRAREEPLPYDPASRPLGVLVGFDGSDQSVLALHYAARAAQRLDAPLTLVTAYTVPTMIYPNLASMPPVPEDQAREAAAAEQLEEAHDHLHGYPGAVEAFTVRGDAAAVLVELSAKARLAVVGARGRGGFLGRLLGTVSSALPEHAHCPTVVVPRQYEIGSGEGAERFAVVADDSPVVAGVDRSPGSDAAARVAARAAQGRGAPLHLVMSIPSPETWGGAYTMLMPDPGVLERQRQDIVADLETDADALRAEFPEVTITCEVTLGDPVDELIERTRSAQLTVVGSRGHGRVAGALLGSVSRTVLAHAEGPVMVVPDLDPDRIGSTPFRPR